MAKKKNITVTKKETKNMKDTHYSIPEWKVKSLKMIGMSYKVPFQEPPFGNSEEEGYFCIDEFRKTPKWQKFLDEVIALGVHYEFAYLDGQGKTIYMPVQIWEKK